MPDGFSLNLDPKFLQDLEKVEQKLKDIAETSDKTSKAIIKNFQEATDKGVGYFLSQMRKANEQLLSFSNASKNMKIGDVSGLSSMNKMASQSTDIINKLIDALVKLSSEQSKSKSSSSKDSDVSKINSLYRERIKLMKQLEHFAQLGAKGMTLTSEESSSISSIYQRLQVIDMEIKSYQKRTDLSKQAIRSLIQGEADFSIAQGNEIRKRQKLVEDENRKKEDKVRQEALHNEKLASLDKKRAEDIVKQQKKELNDYRAYLKSKQDMYKRMFDQIAKQESQMRSKSYNRFQASGDTSNQATAAYNRLYGEHGVKSVNNMNRALQRLQDAQNKLNLNTDKGRQKYDELGRKIQQIKRDLDKSTQANEKFHNSHSKLLNTTDQLQRKLALLFSISAIQGYMDKLVNVRKEFELQQKSLQVLLRDKDQADKLWQQTIDLAVKSPFRVSQLVSYTKQLAAYRIESDKLYDTTKMLSDVSAGLGVDMQRIILAFGQVRAANFLRGTELRQFTEAGIPMLDELAQMFTELEGRAVKAGDVFERISKRMVTFRDVEEVFKRMTSSSGVFYNMQEEQSKTLFGMISNLHDSIDLMLNDIGRSNDGIIKDMVSLTRDLVENWRGVATVLKQVGVTLAMIGLSKFVTGWRIASTAIATGSTSAALAMNGMAGSAARLRIAMSTLGKTISAYPWFLLVGAVASAGHALWEYIDAIDATNAKYDDMSRREIAHIDQLEELQKKTEQYNAIIEDGNSSEQARNKALLENDKILSQIKAKYPELYPLIVRQENKTIDLTKAIERQNEVLGVNIALQQKAKGNLFQEDFSENYKDALESQDALKVSLHNLKSEASQASAQLKKLLASGEISKDVANDFDRLFKSIRKAKNFEEAKEYVYELSDAFKKIGNDANFRIPLFDLFDDVRNKFSELNNEQINYTNSLSTWGQNLDNQMDDFRMGIEDAMEGLSSDEANKKATQWVNQQLDALGVVDKELKKWAQQYIVRETGIKLTFVDEGKKVYTEADLTKEWQKKIWGAIKKVESTNPDIRLGVTLEDVATQDLATVIKTLKESVESAIKENKNVVDVGQIVGQVAYTPKQIQNAKDSVEPLQALADVIGLIIKQTSGNKGKDWMSEVVKGIKEAHQEYIKLNKTLGESESKQMALDKYAKSFAESARNAGLKDISLGQFEFETEGGAIEALEFLKNKLPQSAKQARFKLEEAIGEIRGEVRIRTKAEDDKMLIEEIEDMFSGYEMSIELQKLNIPKDLAKQLFNVDSFDLSSIRSKIESDLAKARGLGGQEDLIKELEKQLEKVEDLENKSQQERLKKYTKYLLKAQSERVKIKMDEIRQLQEIEDTFQLKENVAKSKTLGMTDSQWDAYSKIAKANEEINEEKLKSIGLTDEQIKKVLEYNKAMEKSKQLAIEGVQKETKEKTDKQTWEDFKGTEEYIRLFEDLNSASMSSLTSMKKRLDDMRTSLDDLPPEQLKEIVRLMEKLDEQRIKVNPFKTISEGISELKASREQLKKLKDDMSEKVGIDDFENLKERASQAKDAYELQQAIYKAKQEGKVIAGQEITIGKQTVKVTDDSLAIEEDKLTTLKNSNDALQEFLEKYYKITGQQYKAENKISNTFGSFSKMFSNIAGSVDSLSQSFEQLGIGGQDLQDTMASISQGLNGVANIAQGAMGLMSGNPFEIISGGIQALSGLGEVIGSFIGNGDKKKERQIQREIELVEDLERRYQKLEKAIDNAYALNTLQRSGQQAKSNINQQIAAYERMIQAEKNKKKTDEGRIKEWKQTIEDLREQKAELDKEIVGTATGGILDDVLSAAQDFTNAWLDAFNETGDGLDGLSRNFKETMLEMVKQQAAMLISQAYIDKWKHQLSQYINPNDLELTTDEARRWIDSVTSSLPQLNKALERYFLAMKEAGVDLTGGNSELSGLQRGIQGITEQQADILAAYINSIRFFVSDNNTYLSRIAESLGNTEIENPMVGQLRIIASQTTAINELLNSLTSGGHSMGGRGFRVFIS